MASRLYQNQMRIALVKLFQRPAHIRAFTTIRYNQLLRDTSSSFCCGNRFPQTGAISCTRDFHTSQKFNDTHSVKMPSLSPTMSEGTIVKWCKKEGDTIAPGDVLCEIQTDKAVVSMEYDDEAILAKILIPENKADVKVGTLIALTVDEGDDWKNVEVPADAGETSSDSDSEPVSRKSSSTIIASTSSVTPSSVSHGSFGSERLLGPAVKNYLRKYGLSSSNVPATGPHGTVTKGDVLKHVLNNKIEPLARDATAPLAGSTQPTGKLTRPVKGHAGPATYKDLEITNMRRTIAKRLLQSKSTIPHAYATAHCNMRSLMSFRKTLAAAGLKVSVNDLLVKCVSNALILSPAVNCTWEGDKLKQQSQVDISVAVATPNGLITPIVTNVSQRDVGSISETVRYLAGKAKEGKLQPHEFMGGTFSISNLGMFGIHSFSAIINPPQCAILAVGGTALELDENGKQLPTSKLMLSYDASAIMEDDALKFLAVLKNEVANVNEISMGIYNLDARKETIESNSVVAAVAQ